MILKVAFCIWQDRFTCREKPEYDWGKIADPRYSGLKSMCKNYRLGICDKTSIPQETNCAFDPRKRHKFCSKYTSCHFQVTFLISLLNLKTLKCSNMKCILFLKFLPIELSNNDLLFIVHFLNLENIHHKLITKIPINFFNASQKSSNKICVSNCIAHPSSYWELNKTWADF